MFLSLKVVKDGEVRWVGVVRMPDNSPMIPTENLKLKPLKDKPENLQQITFLCYFMFERIFIHTNSGLSF